MNFTVVLQLAVVVAYVTILVGGRQTREGGWKLVSGLLAFVAAGQIIAMALVVSPSLSCPSPMTLAYTFAKRKRHTPGCFRRAQDTGDRTEGQLGKLRVRDEHITFG